MFSDEERPNKKANGKKSNNQLIYMFTNKLLPPVIKKPTKRKQFKMIISMQRKERMSTIKLSSNKNYKRRKRKSK